MKKIAILYRTICIVLMGFLWHSCTESEVRNEKEEYAIFTLLDSAQTGITFKNNIYETTYQNGLMYHHYYNGAGVATADFNADGLEDIYFVSTLERNQLYLNEGNFKFKDVSKACNCEGSDAVGTGVTVADINGDGLHDIFLSTSGNTEDPKKLINQLLIHQGLDENGIPVFEDQAAKYGLAFPSHSVHASFFDYDKDGDLDMFLLNHGRKSYFDNMIDDLRGKRDAGRGEMLLENIGGKFKDISLEAGIISNNLGYGLAIATSDVNNDGWPDVYVSQDYSERDHLYINLKNGKFEEVALKAFGHVSNFSMGADVADINNDGLMDIMTLDMMAMTNYDRKTSMSGMNPERFWMHVDKGLHHQYMYNALQVNQGNYRAENYPVFSDVAQMTGVHSTGWSWATLIFDMDNDGQNDIFVSNGIKRDYRNNDFKLYKEAKEREALQKGKLDKDAFIQDMFDHMPDGKALNCFFVNKGDLQFERLTVESQKNAAHGAAYADFDNDGDLDIVTNNVDDFPFIYQNNSTFNFLKIRLKEESPDFHLFGTKVKIYTAEGNQEKEYYTSRGFQSTVTSEMIFGLGNSKKIDSLVITWPNGLYQVQKDIAANSTLTVAFNSEKAQPVLKEEKTGYFTEVTKDAGVDFVHKENEFNDFQKETLLPHRMSQFGPALATGDVNGDGLEDFFVGGAKDQAAELYLQTNNGNFQIQSLAIFQKDKFHEDVNALFFDADGDSDLDLYVVSGGYEKSAGDEYYKDRIYTNDGAGNFTESAQIPTPYISGMAVSAIDYDLDGDLDLFLGSRVKPGFYGRKSSSIILENTSSKDKLQFANVTAKVAPDLENYAMVTNASWQDMNFDQWPDLVITNEWGSIDIFLNQDGKGFDLANETGLENHIGLWNGLLIEDFNGDGFLDIAAGNLGNNYKYKASAEKPFYFYLNDFDNNNQDDIVLAYHEEEEVFPLRGRQCSSGQMPFIKKKFKSYDEFGKADIEQVYGEKLENSIKHKATNFSSGIFFGNADMSFDFKPFPNEAQISSVNEIVLLDVNGDQFKDLLLLGNLYGSEVETPRNDAGYGQLLLGEPFGQFKFIPNHQSGLYLKGEVRNAALIKNASHDTFLLVARNNLPIELLKLTFDKRKRMLARME